MSIVKPRLTVRLAVVGVVLAALIAWMMYFGTDSVPAPPWHSGRLGWLSSSFSRHSRNFVINRSRSDASVVDGNVEAALCSGTSRFISPSDIHFGGKVDVWMAD